MSWCSSGITALCQEDCSVVNIREARAAQTGPVSAFPPKMFKLYNTLGLQMECSRQSDGPISPTWTQWWRWLQIIPDVSPIRQLLCKEATGSTCPESFFLLLIFPKGLIKKHIEDSRASLRGNKNNLTSPCPSLTPAYLSSVSVPLRALWILQELNTGKHFYRASLLAISALEPEELVPLCYVARREGL